MEVDFREGRRMNLITITDEMLESAHIEESDRENLKKARYKDFIKLEATIAQAFIRELTPSGLIYVFDQLKEQTWNEAYKLALANSLTRLQNKFTTVKEISCSQEYMAGWEAAIKELNEVYLRSLQ